MKILIMNKLKYYKMIKILKKLIFNRKIIYNKKMIFCKQIKIINFWIFQKYNFIKVKTKKLRII